MAKVPHLTTHQLATLFPMLKRKEFDELKADIQKNGVLVPVVTVNGQILDGRHRMLACKELGIDCPTIEADGDPGLVAAALNLRRRHLRPDQIAAIFKRIAVEVPKLAKKVEEIKEAATARKHKKGPEWREPHERLTAEKPKKSTGKAAAGVGEMLGVSRATVERVDRVARVAPEKLEKIERGQLSAAAVLREKRPEKKPEKRQGASSAPSPKETLVAAGTTTVVVPPSHQEGSSAPSPSPVRALADRSDTELYLDLKREVSQRLVSTTIPGLLAEVYRRAAWKKIAHPTRGALTFGSFLGFVTGSPDGLGLDPRIVMHMARIVPREESLLAKAFAEATPGNGTEPAPPAPRTPMAILQEDALPGYVRMRLIQGVGKTIAELKERDDWEEGRRDGEPLEEATWHLIADYLEALARQVRPETARLETVEVPA